MSRCSDPFLLTLPELVSAKRKIGKAAALYDRENQSLKGFTTRSLNPTEFRSQLHLNFAIELTHKELGAIVSYFDVDGNGTVDVATFISHFFKLGQEERSKIRKYNLDKAKKVAHLKETIRKEKEANVARLKKVITKSCLFVGKDFIFILCNREFAYEYIYRRELQINLLQKMKNEQFKN